MADVVIVVESDDNQTEKESAIEQLQPKDMIVQLTFEELASDDESTMAGVPITSDRNQTTNDIESPEDIAHQKTESLLDGEWTEVMKESPQATTKNQDSLVLDDEQVDEGTFAFI